MTQPILELPPVGSTILALDGVSKSYGSVRAARDIRLDIPRGSIYGFLGPNGAGKTTTIRIIMKIILADEGTITLGGGPWTDRCATGSVTCPRNADSTAR